MRCSSEGFPRSFVESGRFSIGPGWFELTVAMFAEIFERLQLEGLDIESVAVRDFDIKEKRGRLVCWSGRIEGLDDIFERYESESMRVCEVCGRAGRLSGDGEWWLSTRCGEHRIF